MNTRTSTRRAEHRSLDRGVQSQPLASRTPRTNPALMLVPNSLKPLLQTRPLLSSSQGVHFKSFAIEQNRSFHS
jgi:hypothetical protein